MDGSTPAPASTKVTADYSFSEQEEGLAEEAPWDWVYITKPLQTGLEPVFQFDLHFRDMHPATEQWHLHCLPFCLLVSVSEDNLRAGRREAAIIYADAILVAGRKILGQKWGSVISKGRGFSLQFLQS